MGERLMLIVLLSYGGKYVPATAYKIHEMNSKGAPFIPLKGISVGDGMMDPGMYAVLQ